MHIKLLQFIANHVLLTIRLTIMLPFTIRQLRNEYLSILKYLQKMGSLYKYWGECISHAHSISPFQTKGLLVLISTLKCAAAQVWKKPVLQPPSWLFFWHGVLLLCLPIMFCISLIFLALAIFKGCHVLTKTECFLVQFNLKSGGQRVATMLMYLTDNVEGGETFFPQVAIF